MFINSKYMGLLVCYSDWFRKIQVIKGLNSGVLTDIDLNPQATFY